MIGILHHMSARITPPDGRVVSINRRSIPPNNPFGFLVNGFKRVCVHQNLFTGGSPSIIIFKAIRRATVVVTPSTKRGSLSEASIHRSSSEFEVHLSMQWSEDFLHRAVQQYARANSHELAIELLSQSPERSDAENGYMRHPRKITQRSSLGFRPSRRHTCIIAEEGCYRLPPSSLDNTFSRFLLHR